MFSYEVGGLSINHVTMIDDTKENKGMGDAQKKDDEQEDRGMGDGMKKDDK